MSTSNDILEPRLVSVDSHALSVVDDFIQSYSSECEDLGNALNVVIHSLSKDLNNKGVLVAIQSALFRISVHAGGVSEDIMEQLVLAPEINQVVSQCKRNA